MGEWTKRAGSAVALVTAFLIAGTGTALAAPSQTGLDENMTTGESSLTVDSPVTDAATHDISVSFQGGTYSGPSRALAARRRIRRPPPAATRVV